MRRAGRVGVEWETPPDGHWQWQHVQLEVLMDIRRELQRLNILLGCPRFSGIPTTLNTISKKLTKPKRKKVSP